ncbi:uncharacterized protein RAG0_02305 [Rhynchosporium agropyri]|uniref:Cupin 2 conserved barrel domain-containing protein n=3 Tax=Rhynchosporium TaxID=38037 RepID=A0A1E1MGW9_RHYSE|nr:uncharacterized protein RCO7_06957 [Rhynchosporium commune]CZS91777.1 uncharacterized protein RAG0_02305 [Rhynchosporium agropyri]CZT48352.1 uncharacterized protein RSE6_09033 [Rhynchosporium secalis]
MASKSHKDSEEVVRSWGFPKVFTWTDTPNFHYSPHTHENLTTHLVLKGEMIVKFPEDKNPVKKSFGPGERVDIAAGRSHEVWIGGAGCTSVIGE